MGTHPIFESDFDCLTEKKMKDKSQQLFGGESTRTFGGRSKSRNREQTPLAQRGRLNVPSKKRRRVKRGFDAIFNAEESSQLEEDNKENTKLSSKQLKDAIDAFSTDPSSSEGEGEEVLLIPRKRSRTKKLLFTND